MKRTAAAGLVCLTVLGAAVAVTRAETPRLNETERTRARQMLRTVMDAVSKHYYDATYGGMDLPARTERAAASIDAATSVSATYAVIAEALLEFGDSHTYFTPPERALTHELGWTMRMVGDTCFVTAVVPGSDAERRGLRAGDKVLRFESIVPTRRDLWRALYFASVIAPRPLVNVVVQSSGGYPRSVTVRPTATDAHVASAFRRKNAVAHHDRTAVWTLDTFDLSAREIDAALDDLRDARDLVLDLRGNGGGDVKALERITGAFFDRELKIADLRGRTTRKPLLARKRDQPFRGRVIVLVDADSASSAELLARVLQLEHRATIVGDRTAGSVRQAIPVKESIDTDEAPLLFGAVIADAELVMRDGRSLDGFGVVPDVIALPTPQDLAAGRDSVLTRALALFAR